MKVVNPTWAEEMQKRIAQKDKIDVTIKVNVVAQWLIVALSNSNTPFKVFNLGAGVKRITTETDTCPCCHQKLKGN